MSQSGLCLPTLTLAQARERRELRKLADEYAALAMQAQAEGDVATKIHALQKCASIRAQAMEIGT